MEGELSQGELSKASSIEALKKVLKGEGFFGLYKGALANILRSTGSALVMALYHEFQHYMK